jgi:hypothetical protein
MTIAQYLPRWLRSKLRKAAPQNVASVSKKDRQALPTVPIPEPPPKQVPDEDAALRFRIYWRMQRRNGGENCEGWKGPRPQG